MYKRQGYASAIGELGRYIEEHHMNTGDFCVKAILPISESMPSEVRRNLEKIFNCTVRSWYSNEENGIMGLQREEDESYYIDSESYYYEVLKLDSDEPAEPGELGRIVITDLYNYAIPLIRYDNGDLAVEERKEKNGRFRLYLKELYGRRGDMIYDCKGRIEMCIRDRYLFHSRLKDFRLPGSPLPYNRSFHLSCPDKDLPRKYRA